MKTLSAAFDASYASGASPFSGDSGWLWTPSDPRMLERLTMRPAGAATTSGKSACVSATVAKKFTSKVFASTSRTIVGALF